MPDFLLFANPLGDEKSGLVVRFDDGPLDGKKAFLMYLPPLLYFLPLEEGQRYGEHIAYLLSSDEEGRVSYRAESLEESLARIAKEAGL